MAAQESNSDDENSGNVKRFRSGGHWESYNGESYGGESNSGEVIK